MAISFLFNITNDHAWNPGTVFFYNGDINMVQGVHNPEELKYIKQAYKDTTNLDLKTYNWDGKVAPVYNRIFGVLQPFSYQEFIERELERLRKYTASYLDTYKKPKKFKSMMTLNVREEPSKVGVITASINPESVHNIQSLITVCDFYWAKITVNNVTGWVAMGDITGDMYGELIYE
jgi:hypothetical protein